MIFSPAVVVEVEPEELADEPPDEPLEPLEELLPEVVELAAVG
jgi:hypothetical protein